MQWGYIKKNVEQKFEESSEQSSKPSLVLERYPASTKGAQVVKSWSVGVHISWRISNSPTKFYSIMILPQVHLRKPCYDFYFL
jgi:hypothetical protein